MNLKRLFSTEDLLAVWIGMIILIFASTVHFSQYGTIKSEYEKAVIENAANGSSEKVSIKSMDLGSGKSLKNFVSIPKKWEISPLDSIAPNGNTTLLYTMTGLFVFLVILFGVGAKLMGESFLKFTLSFAALFFIGVVSFIIAAQSEVSYLGINYAIWAIAIGVIISNTVGVPEWMKPAIKSEYYIKTGLVILGSEILITKILAIGLPGIFVAWVVTPIVLVVTYIFGQRVLKLKSKSLNMTICADMSVCGVSAAIATAAATKARKEELTIAITLSMVFTVIMMVVMPIVIKALGLPEVLAGAWIGGTLDSTGAVVAAGKFVGDKALDVAATIKMIQNVLIGVVAFCVALYWAIYVERTPNAPRPKVNEIWVRFPKFLIGFIGASIIFSLIHYNLDKPMASAMIDNGIIKGFTKDFKEWLFCLAFVAIGLNTNFKTFSKHIQGSKHITLYCCGQLFNILLTLAMAYLMFYVVFPEVTAKI